MPGSMMSKIFSFFTAVILFLSNLFGVYPAGLVDGINTDTRYFLLYSNCKGYIYKDGDTEIPFRLITPDKPEDGVAYPLIVYLHGAGETGRDNCKQIKRCFIKGLEKYGSKCYVIFPQIGDDSFWDDDDVDAILNKCLDEYLLKKYPIDTSRLYITGISRGGNGTFCQIYAHQGKYAAAMPVSGYHWFMEAPAEDFLPYTKIPMWIAHNSGDPTVSVEHSRKMYNTIVELGGTKARYTEYKSRQHDAWSAFYSEPEVWDWLFAQSLGNN